MTTLFRDSGLELSPIAPLSGKNGRKRKTLIEGLLGATGPKGNLSLDFPALTPAETPANPVPKEL
jgi:hypothetical protein